MTQLERDIRIGILTPYLSASMLQEAQRIGAEDPAWLDRQRAVGLRDAWDQPLQAQGARITPVDLFGLDPPGTARAVMTCDMIVAGCTESAERKVQMLRGTGIPVARYSIFFGGPSGYTGLAPEDAGYALDVLKQPRILQMLLQDPDMIAGLWLREAERVRLAAARISALTAPLLGESVLATPFLEDALGDREVS